MGTIRFGDLTCEASGPERPERLVVLCHGFGAPGTDLVGLAGDVLRRQRALGDRVTFVFPEAPNSLPGFFGARAWWLIDGARYSERVARGELPEIVRETPEGLPKARRQLRAALDAMLRHYQVGWSQLVLGGFSQGAMLTTDLTLRLEEPPAGLCVLSGALICRDEWSRRAPARRGLPVFQSHGLADMMLPFTSAEWLRDLLTEHGLQVSFESFGGGHTIPGSVVGSLGAFIAAQSGGG